MFLFAAPALSSDPRTAILTYHYILYAFATLYIAILVHDETVLERFCSGLVVGLGATIPIFVFQAADYSQTLIAWGLMPGYAPDFVNSNVDFVRYSGMLGHPNEAGHVATLSAAGGAYFALVRRRMFPLLVMVACALILVFYYTRSRGGLLAGGAVLVIPFVLTRGRASVFRVVTMIAFLSLSLIFISQLDFVASQFADDQNSAKNSPIALIQSSLVFRSCLSTRLVCRWGNSFQASGLKVVACYPRIMDLYSWVEYLLYFHSLRFWRHAFRISVFAPMRTYFSPCSRSR